MPRRKSAGSTATRIFICGVICKHHSGLQTARARGIDVGGVVAKQLHAQGGPGSVVQLEETLLADHGRRGATLDESRTRADDGSLAAAASTCFFKL